MNTETTVYSPLTFEEILEKTDCIFEDNVGLRGEIPYYRISDKNSSRIVFEVQRNSLSFGDFKRVFLAFVFNDKKAPVGILVSDKHRLLYETTVKTGTKFKDFEAIGICHSESEFNIRKDLLGIEM